MELNICHLYPDILNLYGDRGNVTCLKKRLEWRGIDCNVEGVSIGDKLEASKYDLFFIGGGQDFEQGVLLQDLSGIAFKHLTNCRRVAACFRTDSNRIFYVRHYFAVPLILLCQQLIYFLC